MLWTILQFVPSLALLYFGAKWLVDGASSLAARFGVSSFVIGLTIVGFGTSTPELVTSLVGGGTIAVGNVVGSNLFNLGVVLGITVLVRPIICQAAVLRFELPVMVALGPLLLAIAWAFGGVGRLAGAAMLLLLGLFLWQSYRRSKVAGDDQLLASEIEEMLGANSGKGGAGTLPRGTLKSALWILAGLVTLMLGGQWLVGLAVSVAESLGVSERLVAVTIVASGTSLPEFATSFVAAIRREGGIALGNVLGSNIFNVLGILGCSALVSPVAFEPSVVRLDLPALTVMQLLAVPIMITGMRVSRAEGALLLASYGLYLALLLGAF